MRLTLSNRGRRFAYLPLNWAAQVSLCLLLVSVLATAARTEVKPPLSVQWIYSMGQDTRRPSPPLVQPGRVYISYGGKLHCLDAITGAELWKFDPKTGSVTTPPVAFQNLIIVGADDSTVYAVNAGDGKQVWDQACAGPVGGTPIILNDLLMLGAQEMIYAMVPATGQLKWVTSLTAPVNAGPVTDGTMLYFLCQDGSLQSVDAGEGRFRWVAMLRTGPNAFPPVVADRRVIVASGNTLVAVSRTGAISWTAEMPVGIGGQPSLIGDGLYVPTVGGAAVGPEGPQYVTRISPTSFVSGTGLIRVLFPRSGREQRTAPYAVSGSATSPPLLEGTALYEGTSNAVIYALNQETGATVWVYRCLSPDQSLDQASTYGIYAPFAIGNDSLYSVTGTGNLYCFSSGAPDTAGPVFSEMKPESSDALSSSKPVDVKFTIVDAGSGVDPSSIQGTVDGVPVQIEFEVASGEATFHLRSTRDGVHIVKVTAKDWRGNVGSEESSFLTDSSIKAAPSTGPGTGQAGQRGTTGTRAGGGGGRGGAGGY